MKLYEALSVWSKRTSQEEIRQLLFLIEWAFTAEKGYRIFSFPWEVVVADGAKYDIRALHNLEEIDLDVGPPSTIAIDGVVVRKAHEIIRTTRRLDKEELRRFTLAAWPCERASGRYVDLVTAAKSLWFEDPQPPLLPVLRTTAKTLPSTVWQLLINDESLED